MTTEFEQYVTQHKLDAFSIFKVAGVRFVNVYSTIKGQPILPETSEKIRAAVLKMTGVPYTGSFVLVKAAGPLPAIPRRR
jgi:hypothetical protein